MKSERHIRIANQLMKDIDNLPNTKTLVESRAKRLDLASIYKQVMNIGSVFPEKPRGMSNYLPQQLSRRVSRTCGSCVKPDVMKRHINGTIDVLKKYSIKLDHWINGDAETDEKKDNVHDMRPTKKE